MKKIIYVLSLMAVLSCSLDEKSYTEVGPDNYVTNAAEAEPVLMSIYKDLTDENMYSYHLSMMFTLGTDISQVEGVVTSAFRVIPTNTHNPSTTEIGGTWQKLYSSIYEANSLIELLEERMKEWDTSNSRLASLYVAEAKVLRALFYFELVRWYGNIVLITSTEQADIAPELYTQAKPEEVYAFIESDLLSAAEVLPWAVDDNMRASNAFRVSKGSALGLLSKVYATWAGYPVLDESKWADAAATARLVVESGKHRLIPDYETVWNNTCNGIWDAGESLIEVSFYSPTGLNSDNTAGRIGKWNGVSADAIAGVRGRNAANVKVVYTFTEQWRKENDPREAISIADYAYSTKEATGVKMLTGDKAVQTFTPRKWDTELRVEEANYIVNNDKSNVNWYILRYSDVLLIFAEACNESGASMIDAIDAVNAVRRRGFGDNDHDLPYSLTRDELREAIRKERAYELCFEGHRKQDLIRWGIYAETIRETAQKLADWSEEGHFTVATYTVEGKHELLPIPYRDLALLKECHQNPNWGK